MFDKKAFGQNLTELKKSLGLTIVQMAERCDLTYATMSGYMMGANMIPLCNVVKISNACGTSPNVLFAGMYSDSPTELDYIGAYNSVFDNLKPEARSVLHSISDAMLDYTLDSSRSLLHSSMGMRIRKVREDSGFNHVNFASLCSTSPITIKNVEAGNTAPGTALFLTICEMLKVTPELLLANDLSVSTYPPKFKYLLPNQMKYFSVAISRIKEYLK